MVIESGWAQWWDPPKSIAATLRRKPEERNKAKLSSPDLKGLIMGRQLPLTAESDLDEDDHGLWSTAASDDCNNNLDARRPRNRPYASSAKDVDDIKEPIWLSQACRGHIGRPHPTRPSSTIQEQDSTCLCHIRIMSLSAIAIIADPAQYGCSLSSPSTPLHSQLMPSFLKGQVTVADCLKPCQRSKSTHLCHEIFEQVSEASDVPNNYVILSQSSSLKVQ
ncbi:hypothetical protein OPV22_024964 [Ensete ventricosum]|uniref:Uncharacterized protein n=1 Tax=Ensete ventricosum TaxID=4639 RepID=A0AAV8P953_ENSVE|nr:hypothetical protein OPV22_024964 [Ensete ventricosum]